MNALLVGADRLGNIPEVLAEFGIRIGGHVTGRQPGHQKRATVPAGTELVILFTVVANLKLHQFGRSETH